MSSSQDLPQQMKRTLSTALLLYVTQKNIQNISPALGQDQVIPRTCRWISAVRPSALSPMPRNSIRQLSRGAAHKYEEQRQEFQTSPQARSGYPRNAQPETSTQAARNERGGGARILRHRQRLRNVRRRRKTAERDFCGGV